MASASPLDSDLLVFGYACRLFRDDARALSIEAGEHLIPWMGNPNLPIDRYDGRGALANLDQFEAPDSGFDLASLLTEEEMRIEEMCEEERYLALHEDDLERENIDEEAEKRGTGAEVAMDYGDGNRTVLAQASKSDSEPPSLRTLANCIEKTAEFIVTQGAQMEILMRAKEANNPKFQFLNPDNPYHPIYKQVLEKKRSRPKGYIPNAALLHQASLEVEKSLQVLTANLPSSAPALAGQRASASSASTDCAYSKLVAKIREQQPQPLPMPVPASAPPAAAATPPPPAPTPPAESADVVQVVPPPINIHPLIDKTAFYVAKNGADMIGVIKKRDETRFAFLNVGNKYNSFYLYKVALYKEMLAEKEEAASQNGAKLMDQTQTGSGIKFPTLKGFFR